MNDFNDDFDEFENDGFDDFNEQSSLKDTFNNNPLLKIFAVIAVIVLIVAALFIFGGSDEKDASRVGPGLNENEILGGEVSDVYAGAIDDVNRQRREDAVRRGTSSIDMVVNPEQKELLTVEEELPAFEDFDPLQTFRNAVSPQEPEIVEPEPTLVAPEAVFPPQAGPQQIQQQSVAAPSPEAIQALAQAMSSAAEGILDNHKPKMGKITQVTPTDFLTSQIQVEDDMATASFDASSADNFAQQDISDSVQTILVPSGTINYAQILIEANSDIPGPVLAQLMSGPLTGARLIGSFTTREKKLVLSFNSIIIDGINQPVSAIAIDPNTTLPGIATDVDNRYWSRVILPAAAKFLQGVGSAIAQDTETTVTVSGDTVIQETEALDFEQELGRGVEEGFEEIADFMEREADGIQPLIRVMRGTPVGVFFTEPVMGVTSNE